MLDLYFLIFLQIVSESFPISSSGHVALAICIIASYNNIYAAKMATFFSSQMMTFLLHVPTIIVVTLFFYTTWQPLLLQLWIRRRVVAKLIIYTCIADCVTVMWYIVFLIRPISLPLSIGFVSTAIMLLSLRWCSSSTKILRLSHMIAIGFFQGIALLPGISRLATVYVTCRWLGIRGTKSFGIAWMLQWPLMVAGALASGVHALSGYSINYVVSIHDLLFISVATLISFIGFYFVYISVRANLVWSISIYMVLPIIIAIFIGC